MKRIFTMGALVALLACCDDGTSSTEDGNDTADANDADDGMETDVECFSPADCSNGIACDGEERCIDGVCRQGTEPDCNDENPCTKDFCSEVTGGCAHEPLDGDDDGYAAKISPDDTACSGNDCDDDNPDVYPGAPELCDSIDNDCDEDIFDDLHILGDDINMSSSPGISLNPSLVFTGSDYAVIWDDDRDGDEEIYFSRFSEDGTRIGPNLRVTDAPGISMEGSLVFTGSEFALAWSDERDHIGEEFDLYFARISMDSEKIGNDLKITVEPAGFYALNASLVFADSEYGVAWHDDHEGNYEIYFTRVSLEGSVQGDLVRISDVPADSMVPSLVLADNEYGVAWFDCRDDEEELEVYFARIAMDGAKIGLDTRISEMPARSTWPSLVFTGSEYAVTWHDYRHGEASDIYFSRVSAEGVTIGDNQRITTSESTKSAYARLVFSGSEFGITWTETWPDGSEERFENYFTRISMEGEKMGENLMVKSDRCVSGYYSMTSLLFNGSDYAIAWEDFRDMSTGNLEIYFNVIGCL